MYEPIQGKYIKSFPLHESQQIIIDNDNELRIKQYVYITRDLNMELLSYGNSLTVIEPKDIGGWIEKYEKLKIYTLVFNYQQFTLAYLDINFQNL
jgi:hypothetical protein